MSHVVWFRDYGAYCGVIASGKSLYGVVAQLAARKPVPAKKLAALDPEHREQSDALCASPEWQRDPLRVTFHPAGKPAVSFDIAPGSALLVEDGPEDADTPTPAAKPRQLVRRPGLPRSGWAIAALLCPDPKEPEQENNRCAKRRQHRQLPIGKMRREDSGWRSPKILCADVLDVRFCLRSEDLRKNQDAEIGR